MNREDVQNLVLTHMKMNIDNLEGLEIDTQKSMAAYGASSIDMIEVVAASMRKLKIRVPRTKLITLKNIDELVDTLHTYVSEASDSTPGSNKGTQGVL